MLMPEAELEYLRRACCVVLIRPGDVFYFNGGIPHVTLSVGPGLNVCAYESIISLNRTHITHFLSQSTWWTGFRVKGLENFDSMGMPEDELKEVKDDMIERLTMI